MKFYLLFPNHLDQLFFVSIVCKVTINIINDNVHFAFCQQCKAIKHKINFANFLPKNKIIQIKLVEHGPVKTVTCISGLDELFPDIYIRLLNLIFGLCFYNYLLGLC